MYRWALCQLQCHLALLLCGPRENCIVVTYKALVHLICILGKAVTESGVLGRSLIESHMFPSPILV